MNSEIQIFRAVRDTRSLLAGGHNAATAAMTACDLNNLPPGDWQEVLAFAQRAATACGQARTALAEAPRGRGRPKAEILEDSDE